MKTKVIEKGDGQNEECVGSFMVTEGDLTSTVSTHKRNFDGTRSVECSG